jgi:hypothetical protein
MPPWCPAIKAKLFGRRTLWDETANHSDALRREAVRHPPSCPYPVVRTVSLGSEIGKDTLWTPLAGMVGGTLPSQYVWDSIFRRVTDCPAGPTEELLSGRQMFK